MPPPLSVALQMDPLDTIDIEKDTSFVMGLEAQNRGHKLWFYHPNDLSYAKGAYHESMGNKQSGEESVTAIAQPLTLSRERGNHYTLGEKRAIDLGRDTDVVLMRQDPPFDMAYITYTHILDLVHGIGDNKTLVVNNPTWVRNSPEKLLIMQFPSLIPPTLITRTVGSVVNFRHQYKDIVIKPLFGNGGIGVFHIKPDDENLHALLEMFLLNSRDPLMVQRYEPAVRQGDKRIILIDGEPVGAINRVPKDGESRSNMHVGGVAMKTFLTERDLEICNTIGGYLRDNGLIFVGIDVIGGYLTEINVTSPTGIQETNAFNDVCLESDLWDCLESKFT